MSAPCPKCGYRRRDGEIAPDWQCPSCGISYAKFGSAPAPDGDDASNDVDRGNSDKTLSFDTVLTVSVTTSGVLLLIRAMTGGLDLVSALMVIPFLLCFVSVVSFTFGDGLYTWNKWEMEFERCDMAGRPVMAKLYYVFFIVASLVFAVFIFIL